KNDDVAITPRKVYRSERPKLRTWTRDNCEIGCCHALRQRRGISNTRTQYPLRVVDGKTIENRHPNSAVRQTAGNRYSRSVLDNVCIRFVGEPEDSNCHPRLRETTNPLNVPLD